MNITLYTNRSAENVVDKSLTQLATTTGKLIEATDITNPSLLLTDIDSYVATCNYIYIQELGRYYYVVETECVKNNLWRLNCHVDVLKSFASQIRQQSGIVERQEFNYNIKLSDPRLKTQADPYTQLLTFPNGFTGNYSFVLAFAGDGAEPQTSGSN